MKTITFYSYKGGVGRTLALCNVANRLAEFGKKVCILDFDLEAPGLHLKYDRYISSGSLKKGLVDYIFEFSEYANVPPDINDFIVNIQLNDQVSKGTMTLIPAGNTKTREYWQKLSCINWKKLFYEEDSVGIDFFVNLKEQIKAQIEPDFLLIDSRTGITDISGLTMSIFADEVVLLAANNQENLEGTGQVISTLAVPGNSINNFRPKIDFILSRIPYFFDAKDKPKETNAKHNAMHLINGMLKNAQVDDYDISKVLIIHSDPDLELKEQFRISYASEASAKENLIPIGLDYLELFEEITKDVISQEEKKAFDEYLKAEALIHRASANKDQLQRIKDLENAIEIYPNSVLGLTYLAITYFKSSDYKKALEYVDRATSISRKDMALLSMKGACYLFLDRYEEAIREFTQILEMDSQNYNALTGLSITMYRTKQFDRALDLQVGLININPENESAWNNYANTLRAMGRYEDAINAIYRSLEINPQNWRATGSLAEIYAAQGDLREFYKNLELSFSFGMDSEHFQEILKYEDIYRQFRYDERFNTLLEKYNIDVDLSAID